jgi:hypothetical protein
MTSASSRLACWRSAAMSSPLRASFATTSQGNARRAPSRGASGGRQVGVRARKVSGVMNHSRFQVAILISRGDGLAACTTIATSHNKPDTKHARIFMRATIADTRHAGHTWLAG